MIQKILKVEGMTCQHCVQTVSKTLGKIIGVHKVDVNLDEKEVTIEFDESKVILEEVSDQIIAAGFEVVGN
jgi:copper chaperone